MKEILMTLLVIPRETVYFSSMGKSNRNLMQTDWWIYPKHFLLAYMFSITDFGNNISVSATSLVEFGKTCDDQTVSIKGKNLVISPDQPIGSTCTLVMNLAWVRLI